MTQDSKPATSTIVAPKAISTWPSWMAAWLFTVVSMLPAMVRNALARGIAKLFSLINNSNRRVFDINIQACYPELSEPERKQFYVDHLAALLQTAFLLPRYWWRFLERMPVKTELIDQHWVDQAKAADQQIIMLTSHTVALDSGLSSRGDLQTL